MKRKKIVGKVGFISGSNEILPKQTPQLLSLFTFNTTTILIGGKLNLLRVFGYMRVVPPQSIGADQVTLCYDLSTHLKDVRRQKPVRIASSPKQRL